MITTENVSNLKAELDALNARRAPLEQQRAAAAGALDAAREAVINGTAETSELIQKQSAFDALAGASESLTEKMKVTMAALGAALDAAERERAAQTVADAESAFEEKCAEMERARDVVRRAVFDGVPEMAACFREAKRLSTELATAKERARPANAAADSDNGDARHQSFAALGRFRQQEAALLCRLLGEGETGLDYAFREMVKRYLGVSK